MEMQIFYLSKAENAFCKHWQGRKYISMHISGRVLVPINSWDKNVYLMLEQK